MCWGTWPYNASSRPRHDCWSCLGSWDDDISNETLITSKWLHSRNSCIGASRWNPGRCLSIFLREVLKHIIWTFPWAILLRLEGSTGFSRIFNIFRRRVSISYITSFLRLGLRWFSIDRCSTSKPFLFNRCNSLYFILQRCFSFPLSFLFQSNLSLLVFIQFKLLIEAERRTWTVVSLP